MRCCSQTPGLRQAPGKQHRREPDEYGAGERCTPRASETLSVLTPAPDSGAEALLGVPRQGFDTLAMHIDLVSGA